MGNEIYKFLNMETITKKGEISAYGYACGHVNRITKGQYYKELYKEHSVFHIHCDVGYLRMFKSYDSLVEAKKVFNRIII